MSTSFGGAAAKEGIRYESLWTIAKIGDLLRSGSGSIYIEPPQSEGIEFVLTHADTKSYHQCKTKLNGNWTVNALRGERVLEAIWTRLADQRAEFWFVSDKPADELERLARIAVKSASPEQFDGMLSTKTPRTAFDSICSEWATAIGCTEGAQVRAAAIDRLRRVHMVHQDRGQVLESAQDKLGAYGYTVPSDALAHLRMFVESDGLCKEYSARAIHDWLRSKGLDLANWAMLGDRVSLMDAVNQRYMARLRDELLLKKTFARPEVDEVVSKLISPQTPRGVIVIGEAGMGKSTVVLQVVDELVAKGTDVLAFRADQLGQDTMTAAAAARDLELPASPAWLVTDNAQRPSVVVVDQMDAVSSVSGRAANRLEAISEIVRQASEHLGVRVLLACRRLDLENDGRLRRLVRADPPLTEIAIGPLPANQVRGLVAEMHLDANALTPAQTNLLSCPLHLRLLADVAEGDGRQALDFNTENDLYAKFWDVKRRRTLDKAGEGPDHWVEVLGALSAYMAQNETHFSPKTAVDRWQLFAEAMASEHVLVRQGDTYCFFHEGFLDYVCARLDVQRGIDLTSWLHQTAQSLFHRTGVRQKLMYLRGGKRTAYLKQTCDLLRAEDVRPHLKQFVLAWLRGLTDPTIEEWSIIEPLLTRGGYLAEEAWDFLYSAAWFDLLDRTGRLANWLANDSTADECFNRIRALERTRPAAVARLLAPYATTGGPWLERMRLWSFFPLLDGDHGLLDLYVKLIRAGLLDTEQQGHSGHFWATLLHLAEKRPKWACELVGAYLNRKLELAVAAGIKSPFDSAAAMIPDHGSDDHALGSCAQQAPEEFLSQVWPFVLATVKRNAAPANGCVRTDGVWSLHRGGVRISVRDCLLDATADALALVAERNPRVFRALAEEVRIGDYETMQYLLLHAFASNGLLYADEAIEYLCERPRRLHADPFQRYKVVRSVIRSATPHCSQNSLESLEQAIASFAPDRERELCVEGYGRFLLLDAVAPDRRTPAMTETHKELCDRFGTRAATERAHRAAFATRVGPPIPDVDISSLTDEQWVAAVTRYGSEELGHDELGRTIGGARQLASALEEHTRKDPSRFARLVMNLPQDANPCYFAAVVRGIAGSSLGMDVIARVCMRCHSLPGRPCGKVISDLIEKTAAKDHGEDLISVVGWYATEGESPSSYFETNARKAKDEEIAGGVWTDGMNSVRGAAAEAIAQLVWHNEDRMRPLRPFVTKMVQDPSASVRACVARVLLMMLKHDGLRQEAVTLFHRLCRHPDDILLATPPVAEVIKYACHDMSDELDDIAARMVSSKCSEVQMAGARAVAIMSLTLGRVHKLTERCLNGSRWHQLGSAQVYAYNLSTSTVKSHCSVALKGLFESPFEDVRKQAADCFNGFEGMGLSAVKNLALALVNSAAYEGEEDGLLHALRHSSAQMPDLTLRACERFLGRVGANVADMRTSAAAQARTVLELIIRAYHQSGNEVPLRTKALGLLDHLVELGVRLPEDVVAPD